MKMHKQLSRQGSTCRLLGEKTDGLLDLRILKLILVENNVKDV
jgi:hypothetical protein